MNKTGLRSICYEATSNLTTTASFPLAISLAVIQAIGALVGRMTLPPGERFPVGNIFGHLLSWDGRWYYGIGTTGYTWNPAVSQIQYQNIAFFPLQGIIDRFAIFVAGTDAIPLIAAISFAAGITSIFYFERLAKTLIGDAATIATVLYAFWPAASFCLMGYPTGIISLCTIGALLAHIENRNWTSALWLGIGSAAAPTMVFVGAALGLHHLIRWAKNGGGVRPLIFIAEWGLIALSGLLAFMIYQAIAFHDPFAFTQAQAAWGKAPGVLGRISSLMHPHRYLQQPNAGLQEIAKGRALIHAGHLKAGAIQMQSGIQRLVNFAAFIIALIGLASASRTLRGSRSVVAWAGWAVFAGYLWFIVATDQNMLAAPRLIFPAIALFLGIGILVHRLPPFARALIVAVFVAASCAEIAFAAAGFWVV